MRSDLLRLVEAGSRLARPGLPRLGLDVRNADGDVAEVFVYDVVGDPYGSASAAEFVPALAAVTAKHITVRINSPGGSVFDGVAIYTALQDHAARVTALVDGVAASAASFIVQAGDERVVRKPAKMMIHNAAGLVCGGAADMRAMADILDDLSTTIAQIYADRSGKPVAQFAAAMDAETWYSAQAAVDAGLADRVDSPTQDDPPANNGRGQLVRARARLTSKRG